MMHAGWNCPLRIALQSRLARESIELTESQRGVLKARKLLTWGVRTDRGNGKPLVEGTGPVIPSDVPSLRNMGVQEWVGAFPNMSG